MICAPRSNVCMILSFQQHPTGYNLNYLQSARDEIREAVQTQNLFHHHGDSHYSDLRGASPADTAVVALYTSKSFPFSLDSSDESFWFTVTFSSITFCNISFMDLQSRGLVMESVPGKFIFLHFYSKDDHIKKLKGLTHNAHSKLFLNGMRASYHLVLSLFVVLKVLRPSYTC